MKCYEYNEANQLKTVTDCDSEDTIVEYVYDYNGLRIIKKNYSSDTLANTVTSWTESFETKAIVGGSTETTVYYYANNEFNNGFNNGYNNGWNNGYNNGYNNNYNNGFNNGYNNGYIQ